MQQYKDLVLDVFNHGVDAIDRTEVGTRSIFGRQMRFDLSQGFPLVTLKFTPLRLVYEELVWYLSGNTNIKSLQEKNVKIWDEWADENGDLGPVYGHQWRNFNSQGIDQIEQLIDGLLNNPNGRRHIVSAWNPSQIDEMALPPCHAFFQFYVKKNKLSCQLYQRSCDVALGLPFNIACYSLLTHIIAKICGFQVGEFIWTGGDVHIYHNHFEGMSQMLNRDPLPLPTLIVPHNLTSINQLTDGSISWGDFELKNYSYHPKIEFKVAV